MPAQARAKGQRFGALGTVRNFIAVLREMSFDDVREQAETVPRLLVLAPDEETATKLGTALTGPEGSRAVTAKPLDAQLRLLGRFDAIVVLDPERTGAAERVRERLPTEEGPAPVFVYGADDPDDERAVDATRALIASRLPDRAPAFGRAFPSFRPAAVKAIVDETSKANAQFALVSNIPAVIPIVGSLAAASADFLVLTKNQILLMFKIAAIHGRDLTDQWGIMRELLPVVWAGLLWRTLAREAASFLPLAAGTIPKVAIAYAGTLAVGRGADFYYRTNLRPTREQMQDYYRQAAEAVRRLPIPVPRGADDSPDGSPPDQAESGTQAAEPSATQSGAHRGDPAS
jgi:uncharacterized protein (DUF697 family)